MTIDRYFEMSKMTIELAIDRMNQIIEYGKLGTSEYEVALDTEALTMAIKSLDAWEKVKREIREYFKEGVMDGDIITTHLCEIIDRHLQEVEE